MTKNFCKLCGARLTPGADTCPGCGRWLTPDIPDVAPPTENAAAPEQGAAAAPPLNALAANSLQSETNLRVKHGAPPVNMAQVDPAEVFQSFFGFPEAAQDGAAPTGSAAAAASDASERSAAAQEEEEIAPAPLGARDGADAAAVSPKAAPAPDAPDLAGKSAAPGAEIPVSPTDAPEQNPFPAQDPAPAKSPAPVPAQSAAPAQNIPHYAAPPQDTATAQNIPRYAAPVPPQYAPGPGMPPYYPPVPWGYAMPEQPDLIPMSGYLAMALIGMIPLVGLVYLIVQAAGNQWRPNRRNFARGFLAARAILWAVFYLAVFLAGVFAMASGYYY